VHHAEDVREVHVAQPQAERTLSRRLAVRSFHEDRPLRVAVHAAGRVVLLERVLRGERQLRLASRDGDAAFRLEAMAPGLPRHEELRDAEEPLLEPALQAAHRSFPDAEPAHDELVARGGVGEHDGPVARDRGELGEEEPRVAAGPAQARDRLGLGDGQRLVAVVGLDDRLRDAGGTSARGVGRRWQRRAQRTERRVDDRGHLDHVLGRRGEGQALHVQQPVRQRHRAEEAVHLGEPSEPHDVHRDVAARSGLDRGPRGHLHAGDLGRFRELADVRDVGERARTVGEDPPQRLQPPVEEHALVVEVADGRGSGDEGEEAGKDHPRVGFPNEFAATRGGSLPRSPPARRPEV
jgi:hypothetical protein